MRLLVLNANTSGFVTRRVADAVRAMASPISGAMGIVRMLRATFTASVGWIESVITSSLSFELVMRETAPPESTPWVM